MTEILSVKFEQNTTTPKQLTMPESSAATTLALTDLVMKFSRIERVPRYADSRRESDVEHSFHLALVALEYANRYYPDIDKGLVAQFAIYHDLPELKTGDLATFNVTDLDLVAKKARDQAAARELCRELPPHAARMVEAYEKQEEPAAQLVCAVDKILPTATDCVGDGERVMREDFNITSTDELIAVHGVLRQRMQQRFPQFPEVVEDHSLLCELYELEFEATTEQQLLQ